MDNIKRQFGSTTISAKVWADDPNDPTHYTSVLVSMVMDMSDGGSVKMDMQLPTYEICTMLIDNLTEQRDWLWPNGVSRYETRGDDDTP